MCTRKGLTSLAAALLGIGSQAAIIGNAGATDILIAGPGIGYTADFFDDSSIVVHGWNEQQNVTLASNVGVDITTYGLFNSVASLTPGTILAGTVVDCHTLCFDPLAGGTVTGGFQFDGTIIGVIVLDMQPTDPFVASDFLIPGSVPAANIPPGHYDNRGMELTINGEFVNVGAHTIQLSLGASSPGDQIRVLTTTVPEPATGLAIGVGLLAIRMRSRRKTSSSQQPIAVNARDASAR